MPKVSIIIPAYNASQWLAETLESALAQTHPDKEIIVVDDGSRDGTAEVARRFSWRGVRMVSQPNRGAAAARNHGLRLATGDFIQYLDSDDLLAPDKITRQIGALATVFCNGVASGSWARFTHSVQDARFERNSLQENLTGTEFLIRAMRQHEMMHPGAWLVPAAVVRRAGLWNEELSLNDDGEYFARVVLTARQIHHVPEAMSYYRSGLKSSLSRGRSQRAWYSQLRSTMLTADHLLASDDSPASRQASADALRRDSLDAYPYCAQLRAAVERRVAQLGGSRLTYAAGPKYRLVARLVGWKLAKRLRNAFV